MRPIIQVLLTKTILNEIDKVRKVDSLSRSSATRLLLNGALKQVNKKGFHQFLTECANLTESNHEKGKLGPP